MEILMVLVLVSMALLSLAVEEVFLRLVVLV
jgi:hypothetical protein